ncbi:transglutaminase family protein [Lysinibacillus piscis]|uniref:Transglutaminase n=1 Tax=Lysinibacillus piscis TaxID=2518931 RepID=A0ABQ5NMP8_9BACI|nr:transglutaminase family protein [Lysinibacillus sp. KH24]GLC89625.1 transglutaminase [Lysinibacillus sp. KH24]
MKYRITHTNSFHYESEVEQSLNTIRLKPRAGECQRVLSYDLTISPQSMIKEYTDIWQNNIGNFFIAEAHSELIITATSTVSVQKAPYIYQINYSEEMRNIFTSQLFKSHYLPYLNTSTLTSLTEAQMQEVLWAIGGKNDNPLKLACDVMTYLFKTIKYDPYATTVSTTAEEAFDLKAGVCQDYTHIMLGILRYCGIPARYISGYLYVGEDDDLIGDTATHAWVEIMVPGIGWIGLDPTNNVEVLDNHIVLCVGRDYRDVSPVEGVYQGGGHTLEVKVDVTKIEHL